MAICPVDFLIDCGGCFKVEDSHLAWIVLAGLEMLNVKSGTNRAKHKLVRG